MQTPIDLTLVLAGRLTVSMKNAVQNGWPKVVLQRNKHGSRSESLLEKSPRLQNNKKETLREIRSKPNHGNAQCQLLQMAAGKRKLQSKFEGVVGS